MSKHEQWTSDEVFVARVVAYLSAEGHKIVSPAKYADAFVPEFIYEAKRILAAFATAMPPTGAPNALATDQNTIDFTQIPDGWHIFRIEFSCGRVMAELHRNSDNRMARSSGYHRGMCAAFLAACAKAKMETSTESEQ